MVLFPDFAKMLISLRKERQLTQNDLARYLNISRAAYTNYELGKREPDFNTLRQIAKYYNVTTDFLLELDEHNKKISDEKEMLDNDNETNEIAAKYKYLPDEIKQAIKAVINIADAGADNRNVVHKQKSAKMG